MYRLKRNRPETTGAVSSLHCFFRIQEGQMTRFNRQNVVPHDVVTSTTGVGVYERNRRSFDLCLKAYVSCGIHNIILKLKDIRLKTNDFSYSAEINFFTLGKFVFAKGLKYKVRLP